MGFLKKVFLLSLLGLAGWGIYSAGQNDLFSFLNSESEEQVQLAKKDRAVKPKSFFSKVRDVMPGSLYEARSMRGSWMTFPTSSTQE